MTIFVRTCLMLALVALLATPALAGVTVLTVTNLNDSGAGSLRQAIIDGNLASETTIIEFDVGLSGTIELASAITISREMTIDGPGTDPIVITNNGGTTGIFDITATTGTVDFDDLTFDNCRIVGDDGGVIRVDQNASVDVDNCAFTNCVVDGDGAATDRRGGAVYALGGTLHTFTSCTFTDCSVVNTVGTVGSGGAIAVAEADVDVSGCVFDDCSATGSGGAIALYQDSGEELGLTDSTFTDCSAGLHGGAIYTEIATDTWSGCTFSGCSATSSGGGVHVTFTGITITISTFTGCTAGADGGAINIDAALSTVTSCTISGNDAGDEGGGIHAGSTSLSVGNCIVAGNTAVTEGPDIDGLVSSQGYNLVGDGTGSGLTDMVNNDRVGSAGAPLDPMLGLLQDNGGPTHTMALLTGSLAINAGDSPVSTDQRGAAPNGQDDIGAYELQDLMTVALNGDTPDSAFINDNDTHTLLLLDLTGTVGDADIAAVDVTLALTVATIADIDEVVLFNDGDEDGSFDDPGEEILTVTDPSALVVSFTSLSEVISEGATENWGVAIVFDAGIAGTVSATIAGGAFDMDDLEAVEGTPLAGNTLSFSGVASDLAVTTEPEGADAGSELGTQPVVEIRDAGGALVLADDTTEVTAAIASGTGTLSGTTTVTASGGVATFTDLSIDAAGSFTLEFTATGLTSDTSASFTMTAVAGDDGDDDDDNGQPMPLVVLLGALALAALVLVRRR